MDAPTIYEVPLTMMREKLDLICLKKLNITNYSEPDLTKWKEFLDKLKYPKSKVTIGLIGKYLELQDAYKSILESFVHAGAINECQVQIVNVHSEFITEDNVAEKLGWFRWFAGSTRFWTSWSGGKDHGCKICKGKRSSLLWYLSRYADGGY